ncbi:MAG TPA: hypothetical protein VK147_09535 [Candidatus Didemnitutus sp.]|nr:hypothetical protein [Candidatus Didemnitutus sp.]
MIIKTRGVNRQVGSLNWSIILIGASSASGTATGVPARAAGPAGAAVGGGGGGTSSFCDCGGKLSSEMVARRTLITFGGGKNQFSISFDAKTYNAIKSKSAIVTINARRVFSAITFFNSAAPY